MIPRSGFAIQHDDANPECHLHKIQVTVPNLEHWRLYGVAKTVADCFKHRYKIGLDVAIEALKDALAQRKATADDM